MSKHFHRQPQNPKPNSDIMTVYVRKKTSFSFFDEAEVLDLKPLQNIPNPKTNILPSFVLNEEQDSAPQSPEDILDCEEESKISQALKQKIESMKETLQFKKMHPFSNKGNPLPGIFKAQTDIDILHSFKSLIFNPNCPKEVAEKHLKKVHRSLFYAVHQLKKPTEIESNGKFVKLVKPNDKNQKTLLLDLDETLISTCPLHENPAFVVEENRFKENFIIGFNIRPYCMNFLEIMSQYYEIFVFTASTGEYAHSIIDMLDPKAEYIKGILFRNHCLRTRRGLYIKDLRIIKNRELKNMVIIDNNAHAFAFHLDNGVPILEWTGDKSDRELKYIVQYLVELAKSDDVRKFNRKNLKLEEFANSELVNV